MLGMNTAAKGRIQLAKANENPAKIINAGDDDKHRHIEDNTKNRNGISVAIGIIFIQVEYRQEKKMTDNQAVRSEKILRPI